MNLMLLAVPLGWVAYFLHWGSVPVFLLVYLLPMMHAGVLLKIDLPPGKPALNACLIICIVHVGLNARHCLFLEAASCAISDASSHMLNFVHPCRSDAESS